MFCDLFSAASKAQKLPPAQNSKLLRCDFPENLATIEEAIKRLDTPVIGKPDIELHMHVLIGSNTGTSPTTAFPDELTDVVTQLRKTLNFRNYELATSIVQCLKETKRNLESQGTATTAQQLTATGSTSLPYRYNIDGMSLATSADGMQRIQIRGFSFSARAGRPCAGAYRT